MGYEVKLAVFEGPLDLLLHLIEKAEIDIYNIPIAEITAQYMTYLGTLDELSLDSASEFLVMAVTLLHIKTRLLLPKPPRLTDENAEDPDEDPRAELVKKLLEYKRYKAAAVRLVELEEKRVRLYACLAEAVLAAPPKAAFPEGLSLAALWQAFQTVLESVPPEATAEIARETITVRQKMEDIERELILRDDGFPFAQLFARRPTRYAVVVTFVALLEMIRARRVKVSQRGNFDAIWVYRYI